MKKIIVMYLLVICSFLNCQWVQILYNQYASYSCIKFIDQYTGWHTGGMSISKSTDGGLNWFMQISFATGVYPRWLFFLNSNYGWVVCQDGITLRTTNGGTNWIITYYEDSTHFRCVYFVDNHTGWAAGTGFTDRKIVKTTNGGANWFPQYFNWNEDYWSIFFLNTQVGWAVGDRGKTLKTTNGGQSWIGYQIGTTQDLNTVFFINQNTGWIGGLYGTLLKTTNSGNNWIFQYAGGIFYHTYNIFFIDSLKGWTVGSYNRITATTNGGNNWFQQNIGAYSEGLFSVNFINAYTGWASGGEKIYKTTNGGGPIGIGKIDQEIPNTFSLHQNYPNPFNPVTKIRFDIPSLVRGGAGLVVLKIYDLLGREVATLVNEQLKPGTYDVEFDGSNFASGIYFYKLIANDFVETKKMILLR